MTNHAEIPISNRKAKEFCDLMKSVFFHINTPVRV